VTYDLNPLLVLVSILIAVIGAYACFDLIIRVQRCSGVQRRQWLALASLAIGGSIWAMHFIAMMAVQLPDMSMRYDGLLTLVSGLASVFMTALALAVVSVGSVSNRRIFIGGVIMGAGITAMHYIGMAGMRGNFELGYDNTWLLISVAVGVVASTLSLWLVMGLQLRGVLRRLLSAIVMGVSIAGVHYSGMIGTQFKPVDEVIELTRPYLDPFTLAMIAAVITFAILAWTLLTLLPDTPGAITDPITSAESAPSTATGYAVANNSIAQLAVPQTTNEPLNALHPAPLDNMQKTADSASDTSKHEAVLPVPEKIAVQNNNTTGFVDIDAITSISAYGHYSTVRTNDGQEHFCNIGFNKLLDGLSSQKLVRVHRSHAVCLRNVVSFRQERDKGILDMGQDKHEIPVSRTHVPQIKKALGLKKKTT